jgi:hypothetical protein
MVPGAFFLQPDDVLERGNPHLAVA